jgi:hypothetical protein
VHGDEGRNPPALRAYDPRFQGRRLIPSFEKLGTPIFLPPRLVFNIVHPRVAEAILRLALNFCEATNRTSALRLDVATRRLREELQAGMEEGEALDKLAGRVAQIFLDPMRAYRIARTETSRAIHSGQWLAAKQSNVVKGKRWLASPEACKELCRPLDGKVVGLDEDFEFDAGAHAAYQAIPFPPRHPHCGCSITMVLMAQYLPRFVQVPRIRAWLRRAA